MKQFPRFVPPLILIAVGHRDRDPRLAILILLPRLDRDGATLRKLVGVAEEIEQGLPDPHLIGLHRLQRGAAVGHDPVGVLGPERCYLRSLDNIVDRLRHENDEPWSSIRPASISGKIENVVDQREQMTGSTTTRSRSSISSSRLRSRASSCSISVTPMIAFSGVRNSCDMFARKPDLVRLFVGRIARGGKCLLVAFALSDVRIDDDDFAIR